MIWRLMHVVAYLVICGGVGIGLAFAIVGAVKVADDLRHPMSPLRRELRALRRIQSAGRRPREVATVGGIDNTRRSGARYPARHRDERPAIPGHEGD